MSVGGEIGKERVGWRATDVLGYRRPTCGSMAASSDWGPYEEEMLAGMGAKGLVWREEENMSWVWWKKSWSLFSGYME